MNLFAECERISAEVLLSAKAACASDRPDPPEDPARQTPLMYAMSLFVL